MLAIPASCWEAEAGGLLKSLRPWVTQSDLVSKNTQILLGAKDGWEKESGNNGVENKKYSLSEC